MNEKIKKQILAIRDSGVTNMFDVKRVQYEANLKGFHELDWTASDVFNRALYSRIFYQITLINAFL